MQGTPSAAELLRAVSTFLESQLLPELAGSLRGSLRTSLDLLGIAERELRLAPLCATDERERLCVLLGRTGSLDELNRDLCRRIRSRELRIDTPGLCDHLWQTANDTLAVDQPRYLRDRRPASA